MSLFSPDGPTERLWDRLVRPFDPVGAIVAVSGHSADAAQRFVSSTITMSLEAESLLDRMPEVLRSLSIATTSRPVRTFGELRGAVLWSETVAARASSPGANGVFVCAATERAYDTDENRVLVHALDRLRGHAVVAGSRRTLNRVTHFLDHHSLQGISRSRPTGRAVRRARSGVKARHYRLAVRLLERMADPIDGAAAASLCDGWTRRQHTHLLAVLERIDEPPRVENGCLVAGHVRYEPLTGIDLGDPFSTH